MSLEELTSWLDGHRRSIDAIQSRYTAAAGEIAAQNYGPWLADEQLKGAASNVRLAAQLVHHETTKLSLVFSSTTDPAALTSILQEYKEAMEKLLAHYLVLCSQAAGSALIRLATVGTRGIVYSVLRLMSLIAEGQTAEFPSATGVVWKLCEELQKLPLSNKAAYRRAMLQHVSVCKDTNAEFAQLVNMSELDDDGAAEGEGVEDEFKEEGYDREELPFALVAQDALKLCTTALQATLEIVTDVADRAAAAAAAADLPAAAQTEVQRWTEECHQFGSVVESALTDLGAELYPPVDVATVGEMLPPALDVVRRLCRTLLGDVFRAEETKAGDESSADGARQVIKELITAAQVDVVSGCLQEAEDIAEKFAALVHSS